MTPKELANLIDNFVEENKPIPATFNRETIDERIEQQPYEMLSRFAVFLREYQS